ncbi:hypothetical protein EDB83DRAFT_2448119 [Lactarius deliciosus]|nr:hypothetical protein EDB83DRAFT_2448119 [Lactarius deliciosus]
MQTRISTGTPTHSHYGQYVRTTLRCIRNTINVPVITAWNIRVCSQTTRPSSARDLPSVTATAATDLPIHYLTFLHMRSSLDPIDLDSPEPWRQLPVQRWHIRRVPPSSRFDEGKGGRGEREFTDEDDPMKPHYVDVGRRTSDDLVLFPKDLRELLHHHACPIWMMAGAAPAYPSVALRDTCTGPRERLDVIESSGGDMEKTKVMYSLN